MNSAVSEEILLKPDDIRVIEETLQEEFPDVLEEYGGVQGFINKFRERINSCMVTYRDREDPEETREPLLKYVDDICIYAQSEIPRRVRSHEDYLQLRREVLVAATRAAMRILASEELQDPRIDLWHNIPPAPPEGAVNFHIKAKQLGDDTNLTNLLKKYFFARNSDGFAFSGIENYYKVWGIITAHTSGRKTVVFYDKNGDHLPQ